MASIRKENNMDVIANVRTFLSNRIKAEPLFRKVYAVQENDSAVKIIYDSEETCENPLFFETLGDLPDVLQLQVVYRNWKHLSKKEQAYVLQRGVMVYEAAE